MHARIRRIAILAAFVPFSAAAEDFPYENFERGTLAEITGGWDRNMADPSGAERKAKLRTYEEGPILRRVVRARYLGDHHSIDTELAKYLRDFERAHSIANGDAELYKEEYLFDDGGKRYWLPVQTRVASFFAGELHPGDTIDLYLIAEGGIWKPDNGVRYVLAVEEFEAVKDTP
jgi:hypothetical protein